MIYIIAFSIGFFFGCCWVGLKNNEPKPPIQIKMAGVVEVVECLN